jgi:hypothetical protein
MENKNNYQNYLDNQLQDPEFAALYALSKEKIRLEIYLEKLKENIQQEVDKRIIIRNLNKITKYVQHIAL